MDLRKLKTLVDLVSESNISELEITEADGRVRIVKAAPGPVPQPMAAPMVAAPAAVLAEVPRTTPNGGPGAPEPAAPEEEGHSIKSPMVGTFYRSASPGTKPLAEIGTAVKAGDALCIIEAMKIMNEIEADVDGIVARILVENGQAVEFGQPLFLIDRRS
jgi:acetyl-CoA carboxylase biotin carboxyl carrier protein